jgi:hypothetical protein
MIKQLIQIPPMVLKGVIKIRQLQLQRMKLKLHLLEEQEDFRCQQEAEYQRLVETNQKSKLQVLKTHLLLEILQLKKRQPKTHLLQ